MTLDMTRLEPLLGTVVNEIGAASNAALVILGDKLGLFRALSAGPMTSDELAKKTGTHERYVREWLSSQAASGFVTYDAEDHRFSMSPEQTAVFADENSPVLMTGGFFSLSAIYADEPKLADAFTTGKGLGWGEHCNCLFCGVERFFRPGYRTHLVAEWLPAMDGVVAKLERGATVADVGCGHGVSTLLMAQAFPNSEFVGIDFHDASIAHARSHGHGLKNLRFQVAKAQDFPGSGFDLVTMFDALHDMGDPVGAVSRAKDVLKPDGTLMLVEPMAGDSLAENLNPVGRVYYASSTNICVPTSMNQEVGRALGAQAGEKRLADVIREGGFASVRKVAATPFNMVLEARR
ncbi:class I SAM-dependent methyltransferase [Bradyrhizobium sp. G127]|uniref:class I SAM-dependent methyltransferase n=1 Tax=Bradyrhizobium sp. G127 TaxID=2904800 RepID=UPI001F3C1D70|nr:class I SAM-dependent methyltransferase [Bradyrhizobium sp. G127]MCF2521389.1 methyltransferase domain-containing protein [Bradyrhizobium sp. G127]